MPKLWSQGPESCEAARRHWSLRLLSGSLGGDRAAWTRRKSRAAADMAGQAVVIQVDTQKHPELAVPFKVRGIPFFAVFYRGRPVVQQAGAGDRKQMEQWLRSAKTIAA
jgi:hypothetical protein